MTGGRTCSIDTALGSFKIMRATAPQALSLARIVSFFSSFIMKRGWSAARI